MGGRRGFLWAVFLLAAGCGLEGPPAVTVPPVAEPARRAAGTPGSPRPEAAEPAPPAQAPSPPREEAPREAREPAPERLPAGIAALLRARRDLALDLDGDGAPELRLERRPGGRVEVRVGLAAGGTRRYLVEGDGRLLRYERDEDGDGVAEELLVRSRRGWFRAVRGERWYYVLEGGEEAGRARRWDRARELPAPGSLPERAGAAGGVDFPRPAEAQSEWEGARRWLYHDRRRGLVGAGVFGRFFPVGGRLFPVNGKEAAAAAGRKPPLPEPAGRPGMNELPPAGGGPAALHAVGPLFVLVRGEERLLLELLPFRHRVRGLPEELLAEPPGRVLCRLLPGRHGVLRDAVLYAAGGGWRGWYDADGDGLREGRVLRWGEESVLGYRRRGLEVREFYYRGELRERRFLAAEGGGLRQVEYYDRGRLLRRERDTDGDGRLDRYEFPGEGGVRVLVDSDGDGLPDRWEREDAPEGDRGPGADAD